MPVLKAGDWLVQVGTKKFGPVETNKDYHACKNELYSKSEYFTNKRLNYYINCIFFVG